MDTKATSSTDPATTGSPTAADGVRKNLWPRLKSFGKELWDDHDLWIRAIAMKGGASTIVIGAVVATTYLAALPVALATTGIAACVGIAALGLYVIGLGGVMVWDRARDLYAKHVTGKPRPPRPLKKPLYKKLLEKPVMQRLLNKPLMQKLRRTHAWRIARKITREPKDLLMAGHAMQGSLVFGGFSVVVLITQFAVLPVAAIAFAAISVASAGYGVYISGQSLLRRFRPRKKVKTAETAPLEKTATLTEPVVTDVSATPAPQPENGGVTTTFAQSTTLPAAESLVKDASPASPASPAKPAKPALPPPAP